MESKYKDQTWFEMAHYRKRTMDNAVWIPLHAIERTEKVGRYGENGNLEDFFGCGSVAVPLENREHVKAVGWSDLGISRTYSGGIDDGEYIPADVFKSWTKEEFKGIYLVMVEERRGEVEREWLVHPDLILTLKLSREGDNWVCPDEGYVEVIKVTRGSNGETQKMEIRAEFLKDYLCARQMGLWLTWYRERREIVEDSTHIKWENQEASEVSDNSRWQRRITTIHEGSGSPFGSQMAVFHVTREGVDVEEDVPQIEFPTADADAKSKQSVRNHQGRKLFVIQGELWREEWVEPGRISPRIRGDEYESNPTFISNAAGTRMDKNGLQNEGRWLWLKPELVKTLLGYRAANLEWHSAQMGDVGADSAGSVTFGVNGLGLINVYAKDIAFLPYWQQQIWAGFNVGPDGGVCEELMRAQAEGIPNETAAPEAFLEREIERLNQAIADKYGVVAFKPHADTKKILSRCHRFRATSAEGLLELAKDLARISADSIDVAQLLTKLTPPKSEKWGSLKCLEKIVALTAGDAVARKIAAPLFGVYDLRLADAHLPAKELAPALANAGIDSNAAAVVQGKMMLDNFVSAIATMANAIAKGSK